MVTSESLVKLVKMIAVTIWSGNSAASLDIKTCLEPLRGSSHALTLDKKISANLVFYSQRESFYQYAIRLSAR